MSYIRDWHFEVIFAFKTHKDKMNLLLQTAYKGLVSRVSNFTFKSLPTYLKNDLGG